MTNNRKQNSQKNKKQQKRQQQQQQKKQNQRKGQQKQQKQQQQKKKRSQKQRGAGMLTELAVPVILVGSREVLKKVLNSRKSKKNRKQTGGFIRQHSPQSFPLKGQPSVPIMSVDEKMKLSMQ